MPIDPQTGEQLPYAGEPGAPAGAPPMPPGGPGAPPMPEGGPGAEEVEQSMQDEAQARAQMIAEMAPQPSEPFDVRAVQGLVDQFNDTVDALGGTDLPDVALPPMPEGENKINSPLPPEIFVPVVALNEALKLIGDGEFFDKYGFEPTELDNNNAVRKVTASLAKMAKDKKLQEAMQQPVGEMEAAPEEASPPSPEAMPDEDQELMDNME